MTIKDGFKLGLGFLLAQLLVGGIVLALSFGTLATIGAFVKEKAISAVLESGSK